MNMAGPGESLGLITAAATRWSLGIRERRTGESRRKGNGGVAVRREPMVGIFCTAGAWHCCRPVVVEEFKRGVPLLEALGMAEDAAPALADLPKLG